MKNENDFLNTYCYFDKKDSTWMVKGETHVYFDNTKYNPKSDLIDRVKKGQTYLQQITDCDILVGFLKEDEREMLQFCLDTLEETRELLEQGLL